MTEVKQEVQEIVIRKEKGETKEGVKFDKYTMNDNGKAVQLSFRKVSNNLSVIPNGISKIRVKDLDLAKSSFYPKYYATFIEVVTKEA